MNIPKSIKIALIHANIPQTDLAIVIGVTSQHLSAVATGRKSCSIALLDKLAKGMDYKVSEFIALGE